MNFVYGFDFAFKDRGYRTNVNLQHYAASISAAVAQYNEKSANSKNPKRLIVLTGAGRLHITLHSANPLNPSYQGIAVKLLSQLLVNNYGFSRFCTGKPGKLFVSV